MQDRIIFICVFLMVLHFTCANNSNIIFEVDEEQHPPVVLGNIALRAGITSIPDLDFSLLTRKDLFEIDESTGDFRAKAVLDRENICGPVPRCVIPASVAVSSAPDFFQRYTVSVVVLDINDKKPVFNTASFPRSISERADINTTIKLPVANDGDYEPKFKVQGYHLLPVSQKTFGLVVHRFNKSDGSADFDLHLKLLQKIDREVIGSYTLTLVASDGGVPVNEGRLLILLSVLDENDNRPEFKDPAYNVTVQEITSVGARILNVSAHDADDGENGRVGYEFATDVDKKVLHYFEIDRSSGTLKLLRSLESEGGSTFSFRVRSFDHGTPTMFSEVTLTIFVEDTINNPPSISISQWKSKNDTSIVSEDVLVGTKVALIDVLDSDSGSNGETSCTASSQHFILEEYNNAGEYTISVARDLDREKTNTHLIIIMCTDRGTPPLSSTAQLFVAVEDVNDNRPTFTKNSYEMTVLENEEVGVLVGNVFAMDTDEGQNAVVRYDLESGVIEFEINESNGFIYTSMKDLDREVQDRYVFKVYAIDQGSQPLTSTATVTVNIADVNDESPKFENSTYIFFISEHTGKNTVIGQLKAVDQDLGLGGEVEYVLIHSPVHPDPPFSLSQKDGSIRVTQPLDYEKIRLYNFVVTAVDFGTPPKNSSVEIHIHIQDENDNSPVIVFPSKDNFSVTLNLQVSPGHEVIRVRAHDLDSGENGRLSYSIGDSISLTTKLFWINEDTGVIALADDLTETNVRNYNVVISVQDNGTPQRVSQALLQLDIIEQTSQRSAKLSYTIIVIIIVCTTFFIVAIIMVIFCSVWYLDNRKVYSNKSNNLTFEPINQQKDNIQEEVDNDEFQHSIISGFPSQKQNASLQSPRCENKLKNSKKSVTFDKAIRNSDTSIAIESDGRDSNSFHNGDTTCPANTSQGLLYSPHFPRTFKTFGSYSLSNSPNCRLVNPSCTSDRTHNLLPSVFSKNYTHDSRDAASLEGERGSNSDFLELGASINMKGTSGCRKVNAADEMVDVALERHNALVRSMRDHERITLSTGKKVSQRETNCFEDYCVCECVRE
ncbi:unnamed protein product [Candidula unifasciata]|uniref:Cadherin domain-containing protein n=1 Tax=Candidula unifasciata TaxID=100452 RepID=A0A8S3ZLS2_9EUPU|nr:unnamed protein product [Candidula unifasciata]